MKIGVRIQLECPREDREFVFLGPYEWVQITYADIRIPPDGDTIAVYDPKTDDWFFETGVLHEGVPVNWSDVVIAPAVLTDG